MPLTDNNTAASLTENQSHDFDGRSELILDVAAHLVCLESTKSLPKSSPAEQLAVCSPHL